MNYNEKCSYCGRLGTYAKGLCISCYNRQRNNGGVMVPSMEEQMTAKWVGMHINGWEAIAVLPKQKLLVKCPYCGRTKIIGRGHLAKHNTRPCVCEIERLTPRTETQARIYKALLHEKGSLTKAAEALGISKQAVSSCLETMRKNNAR